MTIYLINKETGETSNTYTNVISWGKNFVEFMNGKYRGKVYCNEETEYFSDSIPEVVNEENVELETVEI